MKQLGSKANGSFHCRPLTSSDIVTACNLMDELKASFAGLTGRAVYQALCWDAVKNNGIILVVAAVEECLVGFAAAVIDADTYWRRFIWRHPFLSMNAVLKRTVRGGMPSGGSCWGASSRSTARVLYIAVTKRFRNKGVGTCLYRALFDELTQRGVNLVEAHIDADNVPAIQLYIGMGGQVVARSNFLLASLDLAVQRDAGGH